MTTSASPTAAYDLAQRLLVCALDRVDATEPIGGHGGVQRACVVWGEIAWDNCECGQLVVSIGREFPSNEFPFEGGTGVGTGTQAVSRQSRCGSPVWVIEYTVSILRCMPIGGDDAEPPACADLDEAARKAAIDSWAVRTGVACCLIDMKSKLQPNGAPEIHEYLIREQLSRGPEGGCGGSDLNLLVGIRNCFCPAEPGGSS